MPSLLRPLLILLLFAGVGARAVDFDWEALPPLPEPLYSFYAGVHNGAVIVAGGASMNATDFVAHDTVYVLEPGADDWREAGRLSRARAGRGAVTNAEGLWILGGTDGVEYYRDLVRIRYVNGALEIQEPSPLQAPLPDGAIRLEAAIAGDFLYAYARPKSGGDPQLWRIRWAVDADTWEVVQPPPPAALNVEEIAARGATLYTFARDEERRLRIHAFGPAPVWTEITANGADAGIVTATPFGLNHLIVWSGDARTAHAYHLVTDSWLDIPGLPAQPVEIVPAADGTVFLFSGEADGTIYRGRLRTIVRGFAPLDYAALAAYFAVLVGIGVYFSRRENTTEAFFLGGRKVPWWAVGLSLFGTSLSAITYISIPATAYSGNWVTMVFNLTVMIIGPVLIWWYIPKLREIPVTTAYEYLERRFNLATRLYGSVVFIIFQMGRMSIVLYLPAIALSASTGLNVYFCIVTMGVLATLYTVLGGIEAVIWTDVIQTVVLMFGAVLALFLIYGGIDVPVGEAFRTAWEADKYRAFNWTWDTTAAAVWIVILGGCFGNAYPIMADQTMVQRYFTTATDREAGRALWVHVWMALPAQLLFFSIGTGLWLFFRTHPGLIEPNMPSDYVMPLFVMEMFPVGLKGIILAGLFAASMSSLDSSMNSLAAVFVNDYYRRFARNVNERTALNLARIITLGAGVFGTCGALYVVGVAQDTPVFRIFLDLLGLVGGGLAAIFALGAFTKTANAPGALTGGLVSAALMYYVRESVAVNTLFYGFISFVSAFLVGYAVSLATRKTPQAG
jgi:solute:Na+ symporter, SSS family